MLSFEQCCRLILKHCPNGYARAYAKRGLEMGADAHATQALYLLSNTARWRTGPGRAVNTSLREIARSGE